MWSCVSKSGPPFHKSMHTSTESGCRSRFSAIHKAEPPSKLPTCPIERVCLWPQRVRGGRSGDEDADRGLELRTAIQIFAIRM